ncbi:MAG: hypothetical protein AAF086_03325 [Planctomycetota bacterium]
MSMLPALIVWITLPHGGHVRSGTVTEVEVKPILAAMPETLELAWQLVYGPFVVGQGRLSVADTGNTLKLDIPEVRVRTPMRLHFQVLSTAPDVEPINDGSLELWVYPPVAETDQQALFGEIVGNNMVYVGAGMDPGLDQLLSDMGIEVSPITVEEYSRLVVSAWILVGQDAMNPTVEKALGRALQRGARVIVLNQHDWATSDAGYARRAVTPATWNDRHPLLAGIEPLWLNSKLARLRSVLVRRVNEDERAVAGWPHPETLSREIQSINQATPELDETDDATPSNGIQNKQQWESLRLFDAIVWTHRVGEGLQVNWQMPVTDWSQDPMAYELLYNTLIYLAYAPPKWEGSPRETLEGIAK